MCCTMLYMTTNSQPTWKEVMEPLAQNEGLWPYIRTCAETILINSMHDMGDFDSGISSSDLNHTVFGYARQVFMDPSLCPGSDYAGRVLRFMVNNGGGEARR
jgi:hypothetical protein